MRTEGVYTYQCGKCGTFFAVVSRFSITEDYSDVLGCPKCGSGADIQGEGFINHFAYELSKYSPEDAADKKDDSYPELLTADHVAKCLGISKRVAYELMDQKDFPLIRIRRSKRVKKEKFFEWLDNHSER
jgi:excisionase family DNA binding protein